MGDVTNRVGKQYKEILPTRISLTEAIMACYDIEGNTVDCTDSNSIGVTSSTGVGDVNSGLNLMNNPVVASSVSPSGTTVLPSWATNLINIGSGVIQRVVSPTQSNGLQLRINPSTGQQQYYNPATNQYVGAPLGGSSLSSIFSGNSGIILVVFALIVAFFAFGGKRS
jgi:hypothetical protein